LNRREWLEHVNGQRRDLGMVSKEKEPRERKNLRNTGGCSIIGDKPLKHRRKLATEYASWGQQGTKGNTLGKTGVF